MILKCTAERTTPGIMLIGLNVATDPRGTDHCAAIVGSAFRGETLPTYNLTAGTYRG